MPREDIVLLNPCASSLFRLKLHVFAYFKRQDSNPRPHEFCSTCVCSTAVLQLLPSWPCEDKPICTRVLKIELNMLNNISSFSETFPSELISLQPDSFCKRNIAPDKKQTLTESVNYFARLINFATVFAIL